MDDIGKRIRAERKARDWNQGDLAAAVRRINPELRTTQTTIHSIEAGRSKNPTILHEMARALGVTERWLKTGLGPKEPTAITATDQAETIYAAAFEAFQILGSDPEEAAAMLEVLKAVVQKQLSRGKPADRDTLRQSLLEVAARQFLQSRRSQTPRA